MEYIVRDLDILGINIKNGEKDGRAWTMVTFEVNPNTEQVNDFAFTGKVSCFDYDGSATKYKVGDKISGTIYQKGDYWNIKLPYEKKPYSRGAQGNAGAYATKDEVKLLAERVSKLEALQFSKASLEPKEDPTDDLPF